jgi:hypothetical protein
MAADHLMPGCDQLRYEAASERAARAGNEDSHGVFLSLGVCAATSGLWATRETPERFTM